MSSLRQLTYAFILLSTCLAVSSAKADDLLLSLTDTLVRSVLTAHSDDDLLRSLAERRARILVDEAPTHPRRILEVTIPQSVWTQISEPLQQYVERFEELEGIMTVVSLNNKDGSRIFQTALKATDLSEIVFLYFDLLPRELPIGRMVRVRGILLPRQDGGPDRSARHMVIRSDGDALEVLSETNVITAPSAVGRQRTGVFLARFDGDPELGAHSAYAREWVFTQLDGRLRRHSLGLAWLQRRETEQLQLATTQTCDIEMIEQQLSQTLAESGGDMAAYDRIFLILPSLECSWRTATTFPASPNVILVNEKPTTKRLFHALIHGLGMPDFQVDPCNFDALHSECRSKLLPELQQLSQVGTISISPYHKEIAGWLNAKGVDRISKIDGGGMYRIWAADAVMVKTRRLALKIERPAPLVQSRTTYYVEYRVRKLGSERLPPEVVIYMVSGRSIASTFNLTFPVPVQEELQEAISLSPGRFVDHAAGLEIEIARASPWTADLDISFDPTTCVRASPTLELIPWETPYLSAGSEVRFKVAISSRDSWNCGPASASVHLQLPTTWSVQQDPETLMLEPDATVQVDISVSTPPGEAPGFRELEWVVQGDVPVTTRRSLTFVLSSILHADDTFSCFDEFKGPVIKKITGDQGYTNFRLKDWTQEYSRIDARGAIWRQEHLKGGGTKPSSAHMVIIGGGWPDEPRPALCWVGGRFIGSTPLNFGYRDFKNNGGVGLGLNSNGGVIDGVRFHNVGEDGMYASNGNMASLEPHRTKVVKNVWITHSPASFLENDEVANLLVDDVLADGTFNGLSVDPGQDYGPRGVVARNKVAMTNTLIRLRKMADSKVSTYLVTDYLTWLKGRKGYIPEFSIHNTIFATDGWSASDPIGNGQKDSYDRIVECSNNTIAWMSDEPLPSNFPMPPSHCFRIVKGQEARDLWEAAKQNWINCHPKVERIPGDPASDLSQCDPNAYGGGGTGTASAGISD